MIIKITEPLNLLECFKLDAIFKAKLWIYHFYSIQVLQLIFKNTECGTNLILYTTG